MRQVMWVRLGLALVLAVNLGVFVSGGAGQPGNPPAGEKTEAAKTLAKNEALRVKLGQDDEYKRLKEKLPSFDLGGKKHYVAEGDLLLDDDELLFYAQKRKTQVLRYELAKKGELTDPAETLPGQLVIVRLSNGKFAGWQPGQPIRYVVNKAAFGTSYDLVVDSMHRAAKNWMDTGANVIFEHLQAKDTLPRGQLIDQGGAPIGFTFLVEAANLPGGTIAMSFFPPDPKNRRRLLIAPSWLNFDRKVGVLTHELGHVLGFRHEHIRTEAPQGCGREDLGFDVPITEYDRDSIMHYICGGINPPLTISALDREGVRACYGTRNLAAGFGVGPQIEPPLLPRNAHAAIEP